jgi:hypothetical protein
MSGEYEVSLVHFSDFLLWLLILLSIIKFVWLIVRQFSFH